MILLPPLSKDWDYRHELPRLAERTVLIFKGMCLDSAKSGFGSEVTILEFFSNDKVIFKNCLEPA